MEPKRIAELIEGEIDGVNTPTESAELQRLVATDPAARARLAALRETARLLAAAGAEQVDPPAGLRGRIMGEVHARAESGTVRAGRRGRFAPVLRYALAAALGLAAGVLVLVALGWEARPGALRDVVPLRGTLAPWAPGGIAVGPAERVTVDGCDVTVRTGRNGPLLALELEFAAAAPGELQLVWAGGAVFAGVTDGDDPAAAGLPEGLRAAPGQVTFASGPPARSRLLLRGATNAAVALRLARLVDGQVRGECNLGAR